MKRLSLLGLLLAFLVCSVIVAQAEGIDLAFKYTKGQVNKYQLSTNTKLMIAGLEGMAGSDDMLNVKMSMNITEKVLEVYEDGSAKIEAIYSNFAMTAPGVSPSDMADIPKSHSMIMTVGKNGQVLQLQGADDNPGFMGMGVPGMEFGNVMNQMGVMGVILPDQPVQVGGTWKKTVQFGNSSDNLRIISTLLGDAVQVGNKTACKIKQDYIGTLGPEAIATASGASGMSAEMVAKMIKEVDLKGWAVVYFDSVNGHVIKSNSNIVATVQVEMPTMTGMDDGSTVSSAMPMTMKLDMTINLARIQ